MIKQEFQITNEKIRIAYTRTNLYTQKLEQLLSAILCIMNFQLPAKLSKSSGHFSLSLNLQSNLCGDVQQSTIGRLIFLKIWAYYLGHTIQFQFSMEWTGFEPVLPKIGIYRIFLAQNLQLYRDYLNREKIRLKLKPVFSLPVVNFDFIQQPSIPNSGS